MRKIFTFFAILFSSLVNVYAQDTSFIDAFYEHNAVKLLIDPATGNIVAANQSAELFYGYADLTTMAIQQINQLSPEQVAEERQLAESEGRNFFIFRHRLSDNTVRTVEVHSSPIIYQGERVLFSIIRDISDRRNAENELWHYQDQLELMVEKQTAEIQKKADLINTIFGVALIVLLAVIAQMARLIVLKKRSERSLIESKKRYDLAVEGTGVGVWSWKVGPNKNHWSEQFFSLLGFEENEIRPSLDEWRSRLHPDDRDYVYAALDAHFARGAKYQVEFRLLNKQGEYKWFKALGHTLRDDDNKPIEMAGSLQDIHTRKLRDIALESTASELQQEVGKRADAEKLSKMQRDRLQVILEQASDGIHIVDGSGRIIECSRAFCTMLGYTKEEIMRLTVDDWDQNYPKRSLQQQISDLMRNPTTFETTHRKKSGETFPVEISTQKVMIDDETFLFASARDITERKKIDNAVREANQKLEAIVNSAAVAIAWANDSNEIEYVNPTFTKIFGWELEEIPTVEDWHEKAYKDESYRTAVVDAWNQNVQNSLNNGGAIEPAEVTVTCKDGSERYMLLNGAWAGNLLLAMFSDISEQKSRHDEMEWFASHDPLTGIPNRTLLTRRLVDFTQNSRRRDDKIAVAFIDLDGFKQVNDQYGHEAGDYLLKSLSARLIEHVRETDTVARIGGDEFAVILTDLSNFDESLPFINRLLASVATPVEFQNHMLKVSASIGVTYFPQKSGVDHNTLLKQADQAMYVAKQRGKNQYSVYSPFSEE
ncbi:PAS domain S-box protein [Alteromonas sp. KUL49]|uniref:PAS domain S-box protein n=1 Tax=Alteromonas sp. KUL49 TaxID=2480798 RepID=UPI00102F1327|nr:PAS domain S-box protein [Alteromonas sp. KUL49]TAP40130.1 sensor domain-containing diguanylate cyclase [Alteromonas sp. KUL49]